jgi:signal transduction histidine kinase
MSTHLRPAVRRTARDAALARAIHDLRAPLTIIRGLCETLGRRDPSPSTRRGLRAIDGEVSRLADGLSALVWPGEAETGVFDARALASAAVARFRWAAAERGASVGLRVRGRAVAMGDETAAARAVDNLLANALRHCRPSGEVRVRVHAAGPWVHVRVTDDGAGVPPTDRERIFLPGDRGSAPRGPGQGLGLAIARDIALAAGGALTLEPVGPGATFRLTLPRAAEPVGDACPAA